MTSIRFKRGTAAEWTAANPVLGSGEPGYEKDTNKVKLGDGVSAWSELEYFFDADAVQALVETAVDAALGGVVVDVDYTNIPAGVPVYVFWTAGGGFPARPTSRTDIPVIVRAPLSAGSPPKVTPPATNGFYEAIDSWEVTP